ncbi:MAG: S-layer homology domain-containing protein [Clostridia bacterium]|nr:S-layer homology domain-containing protein [Clostridia bacterium]
MKKILSLVLILACILALAVPASAAKEPDLQALVNETAKYMLSAVPAPGSNDIGGEWAVLGLARSSYTVPNGYFEGYYGKLEARVKEAKGVLHKRKYTEYSRVIVTLSAIGKDARDVAGYNLLTPLGDYEKTIWQGLNGPIWALIALDSANYEMPQNPEAETQATRQMYIDCILAEELDEGGWTLSRKTSADPADPDITGMALQALAKYKNQPAVAAAIDRALNCMSKKQDAEGGFSNMWGAANCESTAQVLTALCELGISWTDERFVKNGISLLDNLLSFRTAAGGFLHIADGSDGDNQMTAEQGFYTLVACLRFEKGKNSLYRMTDAISIGDAPAVEERAPGTGLAGKNEDVQPRPVTKAGITFADIKKSQNKAAIEALAAREIINGMNEAEFRPDATMTRAQYATIVVKALGLTPQANGKFKDVAANAWYAPYVGTANACGIVNGRSDTEFDPEGTITRQEAAVMTVRAAKLCGLETAINEAAINDILCDYMDYRTIASWAKEAMAFCYANELLDTSAMNAEPMREILRCEVAEMLYRMLFLANLI